MIGRKHKPNESCTDPSCSYDFRVDQYDYDSVVLITYTQNHVITTTRNGNVEQYIFNSLLTGRALPRYATWILRCAPHETLRDVMASFGEERRVDCLYHDTATEYAIRANHDIMVSAVITPTEETA